MVKVVFHWFDVIVMVKVVFHWFDVTVMVKAVFHWFDVTVVVKTVFHWLMSVVTVVIKTVFHWFDVSCHSGGKGSVPLVWCQFVTVMVKAVFHWFDVIVMVKTVFHWFDVTVVVKAVFHWFDVSCHSGGKGSVPLVWCWWLWNRSSLAWSSVTTAFCSWVQCCMLLVLIWSGGWAFCLNICWWFFVEK